MAITHADRLRIVVRWLTAEHGKSQQELGEIFGYPNGSYFSQLLSGKKQINPALDERIVAFDNRINPAFLSGDSNEMLMPGAESGLDPEDLMRNAQADQSAPVNIKAPKSPGIFVPAELAQMVTDLTATVREQQRIIGTMVDTWAKEKEGAK